MKKLYTTQVDTQLGPLQIICDDSYIIRLLFENDNPNTAHEWMEKYIGSFQLSGENRLSSECADQILAYLEGRVQTFTLPTVLYGSEFEKKIWQGLMKIPYGHTISYQQLAELCAVSGARAVGGAVGRNPIPIIVPCHRVIRSDGTLGGFRGGLANKLTLLKTEGISTFMP